LFRLVTWHFCTDLLRQTLNNLWRDGSWKQAGTWTSGWRTLFGRDGIVPQMVGPWRDYLRANFHPAQRPDELSRRWLAEHAADYSLVRAAA
jgi:predicted metal-dependent hydrolase